jgi:hypothetical protein
LKELQRLRNHFVKIPLESVLNEWFNTGLGGGFSSQIDIMGRLKYVRHELEALEPRVLLSASVGRWGRDFGHSSARGHQATTAAASSAAIAPASVAGRWLFYNQSAFDGNNASAGAADDNAVAPDKNPLQPGGFAQFPNITNYVQGINGVMIDIAGLTGTPALTDFGFKVGNTTAVTQWTAAPDPSAMLVRPGFGVGGSTRVEFTWAGGTIVNEWLSVTTLADANTGLTTPDVFYYGSLIGFSTGAANPSNTQFQMSQGDIRYAAEDLHTFLNPAGLGNAHDYNRDGKVDATDEVIAGIGVSRGLSLVNLDFETITWSPAIVITQGGTYSGNWESLDSKLPAVAVNTTQPVTIVNSNVRGMDNLIVSGVAGVNLTVLNTTGTALNPNHLGTAPGRFVTVDGFTTIDIENNTLISTAGIELNNYAGGPALFNPVKVVKNRSVNIDGRYSDGAGGFKTGVNDYLAVQFVQITGSPRMPGAEIAWNQVVNQPGRSRVEDNISIFKSGGTSNDPIRIHDNYIQGAYPVDPAHATGYTGGGIMLADGQGATLDTDPAYVQAYNNIIVSTSNYGIAISSGHANVIYNNVVVSSGLLPDGTPIAYLNVGIYIWNSDNDPFFSMNVAFNNTVGFALPGGRNDYWLPNAALQFNNTSLAGPVTLQVEADYFASWLQKLAANGIRLGAA